MSQPSWAAWIEISNVGISLAFKYCRSPLGLRGLKSIEGTFDAKRAKSRSPLGLRGLKSINVVIASSTSSVAALLGCVD